MREQLRYIASFAAFATARKKRVASDAIAYQQVSGSLDLPVGLEVKWLGTAGFALTYQGITVLIDPYVTRLGIKAMLAGIPVAANREVLNRYVPRADAILVGHTHFDHALDVPVLVARDGCKAFGGTSLANLLVLHQLQEHAVVVVPKREYEVGPFRFQFIPSVHSKLVLGLAVPMDGELCCESVDDLTPRAYACGQVWGIRVEVAGVSFYHQGSADLLDDEILPRSVDYFLCGVAGRGFTARYLERIIGKLSPRVIVPNHFDNFFIALEKPLDFSLNVNFAGFCDEVAAVSKQLPVIALPLAR